MSHALTLQATEVNAIRVSKSGAVTSRNLLGVMSSGNRKERDQVVNSLVTGAWMNGHFAPLAAECGRVFGKLFTDFVRHPSIKMDVVTGIIPKGSPISNRQAWELFFDHLNHQDQTTTNAKLELVPFKSEKRRYMDAINSALLAAKVQAEIQANEKAAADKALDAVNESIGATVSEVASAAPQLEFVPLYEEFTPAPQVEFTSNPTSDTVEAMFPGLAALAEAETV